MFHDGKTTYYKTNCDVYGSLVCHQGLKVSRFSLQPCRNVLKD